MSNSNLKISLLKKNFNTTRTQVVPPQNHLSPLTKTVTMMSTGSPMKMKKKNNLSTTELNMMKRKKTMSLLSTTRWSLNLCKKSIFLLHLSQKLQRKIRNNKLKVNYLCETN